MGFLPNTTNLPIVDTVLTDLGRQLLSRNDGTFSFVKVAFADDEVNYGLIKQYGRALGKEKIERLTPVFEAVTNQAYAQKYKLITVSNPNLVRLPSLRLSGDSTFDSSTGVITLGKTSQRSANITLEQNIAGETSIDVELQDSVFVVELNDLFLSVANTTPDSVDGNRRALYIIPRNSIQNAQGGSVVSMTINAKSISDAQFDVYGTSTSKNIISSYVRVFGKQSGSVREFRVNINKSL